MENKPSFDLNRALRARLEELSQSGSLHADDLEELEHHLKDSIAKLQSTGISMEEAFLRATRNLGGSEIVVDEFLKVNPARIWPSRILCLVAGAVLFFVLPSLSDTVLGFLMRMLWRLPVSGHVLGLLALILRWSPLLGAILAAGWWMNARGDSWARAAASCFRRPWLTTICLILIPIVLAFCLSFAGGFIPSPFDWPEWGNFSQTDFARLAKVKLWLPWAAFFPPGATQEHWSEAAFYIAPALLIFLAVVKWRGALSQPGTGRIWAPRMLWLLMGAVTVYSVLNLSHVWWVPKGVGVIYPFGVPLLINDKFPINGNLAGLVIVIFWWGPLAASMLGLCRLAGAKGELCARAVTQLFRRPVLSALGLIAFPVISTLFFRPVFAPLAVFNGHGSEVVPQRLLTVFGWCHYSLAIAPACLLLGMLVYLVRRRLNAVARLA